MATALVSVAGGIISSVTGPLAAEQFKLLRGMKEELRKLESTVKAIEAVLEDAEAKQVQSQAVRDWLGKLTDVLYEADDLLDSVSTEALRRKVMTQGKTAKKVRIFFFKPKQLFNDLKLANKIKEIREKLDVISAEKRDLHLTVGPVQIRVGVRDTAAYLGEQPIGREDDKKAVIELLDANDKVNVSVIPIVGIGGLGKTALAKLIFNDKEFTEKFDPKLWVCVSDDFDVKTIIKKIVLTEADVMDRLVKRLREEIDGKRYFLVLDDVWNEDIGKWSQLISYLQSDVRGSRILVTTRSVRVANVMTTNLYELKGLDEDASWNLLKQTAFESPQESVDARVEETGREIVRKCSGVPLAVRTVGGLLRFKPLEFWVAFREKELSTLPQNSETGILPTLKLSYDKFPSRLKQCFAYCSLFPKDHEYDKLDLISHWIAQGFVELRVDQCLEDVADEYFMDLLSGSFFQEVNINEFGDIISCKMHDLMHDLSISVAGPLISIAGDESRKINKKTRYIAVYDHSKVLSIDQFSGNADMIRTFCCQVVDLSFYSSFKNLRELNLSYRNLESVPSFITKMKHLRYLNLSWNNFNQFPKSINRLINLQTLILERCLSLKNLPRGFEKLINLRRLDLSQCDSLRYMPRRFGQLTNLQRLTEFVVDSECSGGGLNELNQLNNLRGWLVISGLSHVREDSAEKYEPMNLKQKLRLHSLVLAWDESVNVNDSLNDVSSDGIQPPPSLKYLFMHRYPYSRIPVGFSSLTSLVSFQLYDSKRCQYVSPLSQLPCLKKLDFFSMEGLEYILEYQDTSKFSFFPMLEDLKIVTCPNLKGWWKRGSSAEGENDGQITKVSSIKGHLLHPSCSSPMTHRQIFPNLEKLDIHNNKSLTFFPTSTPLTKLKSLMMGYFGELETLPEEFGQNLTSLEKLKIADCESLKFVHPIQHLTGLTHLEFKYCPKLELDNDENGMQWQGPTTLQTLRIANCNGFTAIPKWIENCKSLEMLQIFYCYHFNSQRCEKEIGEDWPKIAHIPNVNVMEHGQLILRQQI